MKIQISQSSTDILYHLTTLFPAVSIVQKNRFELKPAEGTDVESALSKGMYYLSTTRSKLGAYTLRNIYTSSVIFVLDGAMLGQRYKINPVDYWDTNNNLHGGKMLLRTTNYESEDRLLSRTQFIPAFQYIKAIHAHVNAEKQDKMFALKKAALLHKVPIWFYEDRKALTLMDTRKAVPVKFDQVLPTENPPSAYRFKRLRRNSILPWIQLWTYPLKPGEKDQWKIAKQLGDPAYRVYQMLRYSDAINSFNCDLHNEKSTPYEDPTKGREMLDKLVGIMRNLRATPKQFMDRLSNKWYPEYAHLNMGNKI